MSSSRLRRIKNDLTEVQQNASLPPLLTFTQTENSSIILFSFNLDETSSLYAGANFQIEVSFPENYPHKPPSFTFKHTVPYHFLVDQINGKVIGLSKLSTWSMLFTLQSIFSDLYSKFVNEPSQEDAEQCGVNEDMITEYRNTPQIYREKARNSVRKLQLTVIENPLDSNEMKDEESTESNETIHEVVVDENNLQPSNPILEQPLDSRFVNSSNHHKIVSHEDEWNYEYGLYHLNMRYGNYNQ
ncbi:predicted protein [Naegleria gruberi]|uniref:Predicted protein n=1 Tax=Naegleria gruberi TaxID=5762 RepID=D2V1X9_NAEGR|nr:uncharacterized protein NAEGRDRAFT_62733 [Naegleria gruberi]EFC49238.1 predicted protein [Naegleria gruberi]|eukprot:XP_002681982.1 predicted protein [Naegleria gruberi strain NEG-M]